MNLSAAPLVRRHASIVACLFTAALVPLLAGCNPEYNWRPPDHENQVLADVVQLTRSSDFDRAGEAYFSHDMKWVIFQAAPKGEQQYQMYLAPMRYDGHDITGLGRAIRISPTHSRNTCGFFSPDGNSLIFASTAGKEDRDLPSAGYQRSGHDYRWSFPAGMEIFRADGWQGAISVAEPGTIVDLAKHPLTNNRAYDAECAYSPDGKWIIFCSNRAGGESNAATSQPAGDLDLYAMHPDGTGVVQLTHTPGYDGGPFFSPDGKRIVFRTDRAKKDYLQVYVADLTFDRSGNITGIANQRQLTHDERVNWGPYWHPDAWHIIYAGRLEGVSSYELWLTRAEGSHKTRVTFSPGADVLPVFSPDGRYLMWASKRAGDGTTQIFLAKFKMPKGA